MHDTVMMHDIACVPGAGARGEEQVYSANDGGGGGGGGGGG